MAIKGRYTIVAVFAVIVVSVLVYQAVASSDNDPGSNADPLVTRSYVDQYTQWRVAELKTDQVLRCYAGTELIPRRGQAIVVDPAGNGIPDVTDGVDIHANSPVPLNHHLIVPRDDGRGLKALSPVVVLYKGHISVQ